MKSGRLAVVLDQNRTALTKPRVKVFFSTKSGLPVERGSSTWLERMS